MDRIRTNSISALFRLRRSREAQEAASVPHLDIAHARPDPSLLRIYYTAAVALARGSSTRPGLPLELVIYICRLADFVILKMRRAPEGIREVHAWGPKVESRVWFQTESLTKETLSRIKSIQLITMSRRQSFVSDRHAGSWSWFEIRVARPMEDDPSQFEVKRRPDGDELSRRSHSHPVEEETGGHHMEFAEHRGLTFGPEDQLWDGIEEGDVLQVLMKAQFAAWINVASDGILKINTWWEPSPEMLGLIYK